MFRTWKLLFYHGDWPTSCQNLLLQLQPTCRKDFRESALYKGSKKKFSPQIEIQAFSLPKRTHVSLVEGILDTCIGALCLEKFKYTRIPVWRWTTNCFVLIFTWVASRIQLIWLFWAEIKSKWRVYLASKLLRFNINIKVLILQYIPDM